jgi:creatinine amidohydrolase
MTSDPLRSPTNLLRACLASSLLLAVSCARPTPNRGIVLGDLTWQEAEAVLGPDAIVVIPLGAGSKEHGPHLRLDNDASLAKYYTERVLQAADVVVAPTIAYHYYPAFLEYPGSTHLSFNTARDLVVDIVRSLAGYGPRRFYVLNTGVSTTRPLAASAEVLASEGILMRYTDIIAVSGEATASVEKQERGTHADEIETSEMLYMYPDRVDMSLAVREDTPSVPGGLTRRKDGDGTYSASGIWGDPTLATREKGQVVVEATVKGILNDLAALKTAELPRRN